MLERFTVGVPIEGWNGLFRVKPVHVPVSVSSECGSGGELCNVFDVIIMCTPGQREPSLYITTVCNGRAGNNTPSKRKPMVKKNGYSQIRRKGKSQMEMPMLIPFISGL